MRTIRGKSLLRGKQRPPSLSCTPNQCGLLQCNFWVNCNGDNVCSRYFNKLFKVVHDNISRVSFKAIPGNGDFREHRSKGFFCLNVIMPSMSQETLMPHCAWSNASSRNSSFSSKNCIAYYCRCGVILVAVLPCAVCVNLDVIRLPSVPHPRSALKYPHWRRSWSRESNALECGFYVDIVVQDIRHAIRRMYTGWNLLPATEGRYLCSQYNVAMSCAACQFFRMRDLCEWPECVTLMSLLGLSVSPTYVLKSGSR